MVGSKDILAIVAILRKVTTLVKIYPFLYTILYVVCILVYMFGSDLAASVCDQLFFTSPFIILCTLGLSYSLKLCKWHRLECLLPAFPMFALIIDYIYPLSRFYAIINGVSVIAILIASLVNAYFVFIKTK